MMARRPDPVKPFLVGDSIADILAEARIVPSARTRLVPGANSKLLCPACNGGSTREQSLSLKIDDDGQGAAWHCKRGTCGGNDLVPGSGRIESSDRHRAGGDETPRPRPRPVAVAPKLHKPEEMTRPPELYAYFARRGISGETVDEFGIYACTMRWPALNADGKPIKDGDGEATFEPKPTIVFPYRWGGTIVNRKFRSKDKQFRQDKDSERTLFNVDAITSDDEVIFVEGEMDVLALHEAGFRQVVSMPDGTDNKLLAEDDPKRMENHRFFCLDTNQEAVATVKRIIIATDSDVPGQYLAEELARRLGKVRCWKVTWPEGCKDANDVLRRHAPKGQEPTPEQLEQGRQDLRDAIAAAQPWPLMGLFDLKPGALREFMATGQQPRGLESGIKSLDEIARLPFGGGWLTVVTGIPSHGKALALGTEIPTPQGWRYMADLQPGDLVFAPDGTATKVLAVSEVMHSRPCYRLRFDCGTEVIADAEHQWVTCDDKARRSATQARKKRAGREATKPRGKDQQHLRAFPSSKTTAQIAETLTVRDGQDRTRLNHTIAVAAPVQMNAADLLVPPYTLGVWLGDGTSASSRLTCADADAEILCHVEADGFVVERQAKGASDTTSTYWVGRLPKWSPLGLSTDLRTLGVLNNKHVPQAYLMASQDQRLALLQGLMDTDGYMSAQGQAEFCSINLKLAEAAFTLVASLGMRPSLVAGRATINGRDCGPKYRVLFYPTTQVFRLRRKAERLEAVLGRGRPRLKHRTIVSAERCESVPVKCIQVAHPSHQFLVTRAHIATHNSAFLRCWLAYIAHRHDIGIIWCSPEDNRPEVLALDIAQIVKNQPVREAGGYMPDWMLSEAEQWIRDHITFVYADDPDTEMTYEWLLARAEQAKKRHKRQLLVLDPNNELEHQFQRGESETQYTGRWLRRLKAWSRREGIGLLIAAHPKGQAKDPKTKKYPVVEGYDINGSAMWFNRADLGLTIYREFEGYVNVHCWKARFPAFGVRNSKAVLKRDPRTGRLASCGADTGTDSTQPESGENA
ncbi:toprim domain-containing protein [Falsiroseomonas tokyonensis]|uniref:Toprim domain-containing protein n=1 Tax=Falsiroseomonas tokyonensis TaxID=430521 RepID=A0ABV7C001_9PROT|nr:toprim domain-containing protein [Falsiroseomonas tokyonensis]MBU8540212.1 toprim domain-containing protein [Falsiroseomonas tokyonensis]